VKDYTTDLKSASFTEADPVMTSQLSDIYRATLSTGMNIAIKCVRTAISGNPNILKVRADPVINSNKVIHLRVKHTVMELDTWSRLRHTNILELLGIALFNGRLAMISQWMDNGSIISVVNTHPELDRYVLVRCSSATPVIHSSDFDILLTYRTVLASGGGRCLDTREETGGLT
jgi:hypothetical protein